MKTTYTQEFKSHAVQKALSKSDGVTFKSIAHELGVRYSTLETWIRLSKAQKLSNLIPNTFKDFASRF